LKPALQRRQCALVRVSLTRELGPARGGDLHQLGILVTSSALAARMLRVDDHRRPRPVECTRSRGAVLFDAQVTSFPAPDPTRRLCHGPRLTILSCLGKTHRCRETPSAMSLRPE
jgi:hypothetical protein